MKNYEAHLIRAKITGIRTHFKIALSMGFFFFAMYAYYSYAYYIGTILVVE